MNDSIKIAVSLILCLVAFRSAQAEDAASAKCAGNPDPYINYACLDAYLGDNVAARFANYYSLEMGHAAAPADPGAPPAARAGWPATPQTTPPMPFTEWPYGAATSIGVTRPNNVDSPFMTAIANTSGGQWLQDNHFQIYGWIDGGGNISSNSQRPGGNAPMAYMYSPNTLQFGPNSALYRPRSRYRANRSLGLGYATLCALRRELPLHNGLRYCEQSVA